MKIRDKKRTILTGDGKTYFGRQELVPTDTQICPGGTMLVTWVPRRERILTMMDIYI